MNSNLFFETLLKNFNTWRKLFLHANFLEYNTNTGGLKTNSGGKMTISGGIRLILVAIDELWWKMTNSGGTFAISGAPQNRFPFFNEIQKKYFFGHYSLANNDLAGHIL